MSLLDLFRQEITFEESINHSRELTGLVNQSYTPDLVVGIAVGGILPAYEFSKSTGTAYSQITIGRALDLKQLFEAAPIFLRPLVKAYYECLFMTTNPSLIDGGNFNCDGKKVLIVDDTVHTGKTLDIAITHLKNKGAKQIRSASINYVNGNLPDYFITKGRMKFPWSKNSVHYPRFVSYLEEVSKNKDSISY